MSLLTINNIDTKPVVAELKRIADLLDAYMRIAHDYHLAPPQPLTDASEPDSVTYASDEALAKEEILEEVRRLQGLQLDDIDDAKEEHR